MSITRSCEATHRDRLLAFLLLGTAVFNITDFLLTTYVVSLGHGEANPLMALILPTIWFPIVKFAVVPCLLMLMWFTRRKLGKRILFYALIPFICYLSLLIYFRVIFLKV